MLQPHDGAVEKAWFGVLQGQSGQIRANTTAMPMTVTVVAQSQTAKD